MKSYLIRSKTAYFVRGSLKILYCAGMWDPFLDLMYRGGWTMWPLLMLSGVSVSLSLERMWFFLRNNHPGRLGRVDRLGTLLRRGGSSEARELAQSDTSVYGDTAFRLLGEADPRHVCTDADAVAAIEAQRPRLERFLPTLSTIITAAPMLGILGTVLGIISAFELLSMLSGNAAPLDQAKLSRGIAEALISTAAGLTVAMVTLFPYNAFRAQVDRSLSRLEAVAAAAVQGASVEAKGRRTRQVAAARTPVASPVLHSPHGDDSDNQSDQAVRGPDRAQ